MTNNTNIKPLILKATVTTNKGFAELLAEKNSTKIHVLYFRNSGRQITEYTGTATTKLIDELLAKAMHKIGKENWNLWSY